MSRLPKNISACLFFTGLFSGAHTHAYIEDFYEHAIGTIFQYDMGALCNMKTALCGMRSELCSMRLRYDNIPM